MIWWAWVQICRPAPLLGRICMGFFLGLATPLCGTWIDDDIKEAYQALFELGIATSIEVWADDSKSELIGGLYGLQLGRVFCGESMFHRQTDASKIAFWGLNALCQRVGIELIDCQAQNDHLMSLGTALIP